VVLRRANVKVPERKELENSMESILKNADVVNSVSNILDCQATPGVTPWDGIRQDPGREVATNSKSLPELSQNSLGGGGGGVITEVIGTTREYKILCEPYLPDSPFPSLVSIRYNSRKNRKCCPQGHWIKGSCRRHRNVRWRYVPCRKRNCEVCGPVGRYRIAERIAYGIRQIGVDKCAWIVLTFKEDIEKPVAVRKLTRFIVKLRKGTKKRRSQGHFEYCATFELTKRGRLHINLFVGPWQYMKQAELQKLWGSIAWIAWVQDAGGAGVEASKAYSPESLGNYVSKLEQSVPMDRRVSFSRGWSKMPESGLQRNGSIDWSEADNFDCEYNVEKGYWHEVVPGEYEINGSRVLTGYKCLCFDYCARDGP
jgi:hypothetical protein